MLLQVDELLPKRPGFLMPYRFWLPEGISKNTSIETKRFNTVNKKLQDTSGDLQQLGIMNDHLHDESATHLFAVRTRAEALAACEMVTLSKYHLEEMPFRKFLSQFRRDKGLTLELMGGLCELLGPTSQLAKQRQSILIALKHLQFFLDAVPVVFYGMERAKWSLATHEKAFKKYCLNISSKTWRRI